MAITATTEPAGSTFMIRSEAREWVLAAERGRVDAGVRDVALDVLRRDYGRPARLVLGLISTWAMIIATAVTLATMTVLGEFWGGESGSALAVFMVAGVTVAVGSATVIVLLQRSGRRLTHAISRWATSAVHLPGPQSSGDTDPESTPIWRSAIAPRAAYLALSGIAIACTIAAALTTAHDEAGAFILPLTAAAVLQTIVWIGIYAGIHRALKARL